jgi:hypothetical protein
MKAGEAVLSIRERQKIKKVDVISVNNVRNK